MIKIISSKVAARKTIKARLQKEIPPINEKIKEAMENGEIRIFCDEKLSEPTVKMLKKAGYVVEGWNTLGVKTEIAWYHSYDKLCENQSEVEKIAKEVDLEIVEVQ